MVAVLSNFGEGGRRFLRNFKKLRKPIENFFEMSKIIICDFINIQRFFRL